MDGALRQAINFFTVYKDEYFQRLSSPSLLRDTELGQALTFRSLEPIILELRDLLVGLQSEEILAKVPQLRLEDAVRALRDVNERLETIAQFKIGDNHAEVLREVYLSLERAKEALLWPRLVHLENLSENSMPGIVEKAAVDAEAIKEERAKIERIRSELDEILHGARIASGDAAFEVYAKSFLELADDNKKNASKALALAFIFGAVLVVVVVFHIWFSATRISSWPQSLVNVVALIVAEFALVGGTFVSSRVFAAEKHNETLNRHRTTAIRTFAAFQGATENISIKDTVLVQAAQAIFSPLATGYIKANVDAQDFSIAAAVLSGHKDKT